MATRDEINSEETVGDVFDTLSEKQKKVVYALIGQALEDAGVEDNDYDEEDEDMKHNAFDSDYGHDEDSNFLSHADQEEIIADAKRYGSLKESAIQHGFEDVIMHDGTDPYTYDYTYGVGGTAEERNYLFPEYRNLNSAPTFISRRTEWVAKLLGAVHHTPFSRLKALVADITDTEARAKGYVKGKQKTDEVIKMLKRVTTPQTIYKKQKLDRDDVIDITDFDIVAWLKGEMRVMLDEEIARAILIGDGRGVSDPDKIDETHIRSILHDDKVYTITATAEYDENENKLVKNVMRAALEARVDYKGTGTPNFYCSPVILTKILLVEDEIGRPLYDSVEKVKTALRVNDIITVDVMTPETTGSADGTVLAGLIFNPVDYNIGADKGGSISLFDDFDINYNQNKYLIETRCSGALVKPYSAIALNIALPDEDDSGNGDNDDTP